MASPFVLFVTILALAVSPCLASAEVNTSAIIESLTVDFYKEKCRQVEKIVAEVFKRNAQKTPGAIPGIMRLHFHDCFITGCDGSILLRPERYNYHNSEMAHPANGVSLRGMDVIDDIKAEVEKQCPNVVSCADILAYAARDAIVYVGNPHYTIPAGRRDGVTVDGNFAQGLPKGSFSIDLLTQQYAAKGLTVEDLVVLEGAHSIGQSRCLGTISDKDALANVTGAAETLDKQFGSMVNQKYCPPAQIRNFFNMTLPLNPKKNDSDWGISFYQNIIQGHSALPCDLAMAAIPSTKELVHQYAADSSLWKKKFNQAMIKLGKLNVLTGEQGEIRKHCGVLNAADIPAQ